MNGSTYVRQDAWGPNGAELLHWYEVGVAAMKTRNPDTDPTSWMYQAAIHGKQSLVTLPLWKQCQHGTWYFIAWHRMYVLWFEEIVRDAIVAAGGPPDWALPYWDYTAPSPSDTIPEPFRDPSSALYTPLRNTAPGQDINAGDALEPETTSCEQALSTIPFEPTSLPITGFAGQVVTAPIHFNRGFGILEQQPHNVVHDAVGGDSGLMADPNTAAEDPIFWLHHANIDRLWASWIALGGGRADTTDTGWTGQPFTLFRPDRTEVTMTPLEVEDTTALGYTYDRLETLAEAAADVPPGPGPLTSSGAGARAEIVGGTSEPVVLTGAPAAASVPVDARTRDTLLAAAPGEGGAPRQVLLALDDITAERNPGRPYHVYVNLPDEGLSRDEAREYYAGTMALFGIEQAAQPDSDEHPHPYQVAFDITRLVRRLQSRGEWDPDTVRVTFRPSGSDGAGTAEHVPVSVGRVSVHYG
ncbi:MAG TPA: tyrosinase family protein [Mycobacteriales bacterium]|jgi:tyrosinase